MFRSYSVGKLENARFDFHVAYIITKRSLRFVKLPSEMTAAAQLKSDATGD